MLCFFTFNKRLVKVVFERSFCASVVIVACISFIMYFPLFSHCYIEVS